MLDQADRFFRVGQFEEAITYYDKALALYPRHYWGNRNRGNACIHLGLYEEAIKSYDKSLTINPAPKHGHAWAYHDRGNAYFALGEYQKALDSYKLSLENDPDEVLAAQTKRDREQADRLL